MFGAGPTSAPVGRDRGPKKEKIRIPPGMADPLTITETPPRGVSTNLKPTEPVLLDLDLNLDLFFSSATATRFGFVI